MNNFSKIQCFLLHFAGGNCYSYEFLKKRMPADIEFIQLELPGRGRRYREPLILDKELAIKDYVNQIKQYRNSMPYFIFGHSMGATLGLSVTNQMESLKDPPFQLIVSGNPGPGKTKYGSIENPKRYLMNTENFKKSLRKLGGVPEEILENEEMFAFFSPVMRADFEVLERDSSFNEYEVLYTPIYALMGDQEEKSEEIENWRKFTTSEFQFKILKGNHFFIHDHPFEIVKVFGNIIRKCLVGRR